MTDYTWPADLTPRAQTFYLRTHTSRTLSPLTRTQKVYELTRPMWMTTMTFRGGYAGVPGRNGIGRHSDFGPRLDVMLAKLRGGANRVAIYDFFRPRMRGSNDGHSLTNDAITAGDTDITVGGFVPNAVAFREGDYVGGDGRPHYVMETVFADASGDATATVYPPWEGNVAGGAAVYGNAPGWFRLTEDTFGATEMMPGQPAEYRLEFMEDI